MLAMTGGRIPNVIARACPKQSNMLERIGILCSLIATLAMTLGDMQNIKFCAIMPI